MVGNTDKYRFAVATLGVPQPLRDAVEELCANKFAARELCLAGLSGPIGTLRSTIAGSPSVCDGGLEPLLEVEPLDLFGNIGNGVPIVATSGGWLTTLKKSGAVGAAGATDGTCWLSPALRAPLLDHMMNGDVMLLAGPVSQKQWVLATRVLLRHSLHPVQSYELARPRTT